MKYTASIFVAGALLATSIYAEDAWTPSPLCPYPSEALTRFPYEGDCSKYWECFKGERYSMDCPAGLEFNAEDSRCDNPTVANCDPDVTIIYPTYPHSPIPTVTTPYPGPRPECPFPSDELIFYPVVNNCSQYWECYQGNSYLINCPSGMFWNVLHNYCDFAENVDCSQTTTTPVSTSTLAPNTTATEPPTAAPNTTVTTVVPTPSTTITPTTPVSTSTVAPNTTATEPLTATAETTVTADPNTTVTTIAPNTTVTTAAPNTTVTTGAPNTTVTTAAPNTTVTTAVPTPSTTINPICIGETDGTYLQNPDDCSRFYECVDQQPKEGQCPGDLLWNEDILTCDYPEHVTCLNSTITTAASYKFFDFLFLI